MSEEVQTLFQRAIALYTPPFKFNKFGYINDCRDNVVADNNTKDEDGNGGGPLRIRGWGRLSYLENAEDLQDQVGELITQALNEFWMKNGGVADYKPRYIFKKFDVDRNRNEVERDSGRYVLSYEAEDVGRKLALAEKLLVERDETIRQWELKYMQLEAKSLTNYGDQNVN